jgi:hypothetical protein
MVPKLAWTRQNGGGADRTEEGRAMSMFRLDLERVRANVRSADTEDLLDRATVYRAGMEPAALELIEEELRSRGVGAAELADHAARREGAVLADEGWAISCSRCRRPAVTLRWGWHRLWGLVPIFPRRLAFCEQHRPRDPAS